MDSKVASPSILDVCGSFQKWLARNLMPEQTRRLFLLVAALQNNAPADAIKIAAQMEKFIIGGTDGEPTSLSTSGNDAADPLAGDQSNSAELEETAGGAGENRMRPLPGRARSSGSRLDPNTRTDLQAAILAGGTNSELAARFGLMPRQVNGVRLGLNRRRVSVSGKEGSPVAPDAERDVELAQERAFLLSKKPIPPTLDDVVRFLRQAGDIVVKRGSNFLVDGRLELTAAQLIDRANRKRLLQGKSPFAVAPADGSELDAGPELANGVAKATHAVRSEAIVKDEMCN